MGVVKQFKFKTFCFFFIERMNPLYSSVNCANRHIWEFCLVCVCVCMCVNCLLGKLQERLGKAKGGATERDTKP